MKSFKPDQLVLVRFAPDAPWRLRRYSSPCNAGTAHETQDGRVHSDDSILPYEGNEDLLGIVGDILPTWEPKSGELVAARNKHGVWLPAVFISRKQLLSGKETFAIRWFDFTERLVEEVEPLRKHFNVPKH